MINETNFNATYTAMLQEVKREKILSLVVIGRREYVMTPVELDRFIASMNGCGLLKGIDYTVEQIS